MEVLAKKTYKILLMMLIALNGLDLATTIIGLEFYGLTEINPLFTLEAKTLTLKALLPMVFAFFFIKAWNQVTKYQMHQAKAVLGLILIGLDFFYFAVVLNNLVWLLYCAVIRPFTTVP